VSDNQNRRTKETIIDLSTDPVDGKNKPIRLKEVHPNGAFGIDLQAYLKKGLRLSESED
jgi:hypothetical protein